MSELRSETVINFMDGISYKLSPLTKLKFIASSSFFGEPSYYRYSDDRKFFMDDTNKKSKNIRKYEKLAWVKKYHIFDFTHSELSVTDIFIKAVDDALTHDFKSTLDLAKELRVEHYMRTNPNIIFVRASLHSNRKEFNKHNPKYMKNIGLSIIQRPDDIVTQFKYYLSLKGQKNNLPNILKRTWAEKISKFSAYQLKKYLNTGLVDIVRICHANSDTINEMMKTGNIQTKDEEKTWEVLRSGGKSWEEIISQIDIPHMALLRNLRGMSDELSKEQIVQMCNKLLDGVERGKQYPYRYYTAYSMMDDVNHDDILKYNLSKCVNKSMMHFPKLKGKTISLCDNSGSASGAFNSTYGKTTVSTIANLSGIMTAINSDEGYVGIFGNELFMFYIDKQECILQQLDRLENKSEDINGGTEHGIWLFFDQAIKEKVHYDNIFIYSDMQAGHGGLYGDHKEYKEYIVNDNYIDVLKLVEKYRNVVNPKVNLFTVQVAGYDNNVLPEHIYRGAVLSGWTGNEVKYANYLIKLWDQEDLLVKSNQ